MPNDWTPQQMDAINARDTAIIVSAAAGSGKTSVLIERLLKQISSTDPKIPADRLIVVTFTNDAAAEMKQRLTIGLSKLIEAEPDNYWLIEQQSLIQTAKISTIHSFCFELIRENIHLLEISPGFRIIDESEEKVITSKAIQNVMEYFYCNKADTMKILTDFFCSRSDKDLEKIVLLLYKFIISIPFYEAWLDTQINKFSSDISLHENPWLDEYRLFLSEKIYDFEKEALIAGKLCEDIGACEASSIIHNEAEMFRKLCKKINSDGVAWDERLSGFKSISFDRLKFPKLEADSREFRISERIKKIRSRYKEQLKKLVSESVFTLAEIAEDLKSHEIILSALKELTMAFADEILKTKIEKNAIGFSDAEQLTVKLLAQRNNEGKIAKSPLAKELSDYYKVIMVDEFQDANNTQDLIFKMLSHNGSFELNGDNVFAVGDVKQSIYRFRLANPSIFIDVLNKADTYSKDYHGNNASIMLNKNFRSSKEVVVFVNYIFSQIMSKNVGEIDYTENEALVQSAEFNESKERDTEILLIQTDGLIENSEEDEEAVNLEARSVASKINDMILNGHKVYDKGRLRACSNRDFCILLRNKFSAHLFVRELERYGIKAHADEVEGYLKSREISILLNILKIIDNPLLDIPLVSVLLSPMFMFSAEEIAKIRLLSPKGSIYKALCIAINKPFFGDESNLDNINCTGESYYEKAVFFDKTLDMLRYYASGYSLEQLISTIYDSTDFLSVVQVFKDGEQKKANLRLLLEYAKSYEQSANGGLSGFLRYINIISNQGGDLKQAGKTSQSDDVVSVKTIHKSKGLEFPFVFLCRTSSRFNMTDLNSQMQLNLTYGIGFKIKEKEFLKYYNSLPFISVREKNKNNMISEEMRLLYVALTRAKEKLFITLEMNESFHNDVFDFANDIKLNSGITSKLASKAKSMQDWLLMCLLLHPDCEELRETSKADLTLNNTDFRIKFTKCTDIDEISIQDIQKKALPDTKIIAKLKEEISFSYDYKLSEIPAKLSVSEISKNTEEHEISLRRPSFISDNRVLTGAEKGVAAHTFMQYADFGNAAENAEKECSRLVEMGYLTSNQGDAVDIDKINSFFTSELYERIKNAVNIYRERKFLIRISDLELEDALGDEYRGTDGMLQGIADCIFEEKDGMVLVDYKTDYVKDKLELIENYSRQLELYRNALNKLYPKKIKEKCIYSFKLGEAIYL